MYTITTNYAIGSTLILGRVFIIAPMMFGIITNVLRGRKHYNMVTIPVLNGKTRDDLVWLVGGLEHVLFSHILGIIIPTDFHIFQRDWFNHQPVVGYA